MLAVRYHRHGGPEELIREEISVPEPGVDEVLVKVEVAGVNQADIVRRYGEFYPVPTVFPAVPGREIGGTITMLGSEVTEWKVGDRIFTTMDDGGYAQYAVAKAAKMIKVPDNLDLKTGVALIVQGLTALIVLREAARLEKQESILIQGAGGGVGSISVQLAKLLGAGLVIGSDVSGEKQDFIAQLGADLAVDCTQEGWTRKVMDATGGKGVNVVQEMVGGKIFTDSLACLSEFGRLVVYGFVTRDPIKINPEPLLPGNKTIRGFYLEPYIDRNKPLITAALNELADYVASDKLKISIGGSFSLDDAAESHRLLEAQKAKGKLIILPWE